ncbi:hypothetical protein KY385_02205 [Candidatus Parcubacteria bacterium]|nr:hypothetical protein [Candidatus Parcubacteria bacterium]
MAKPKKENPKLSAARIAEVLTKAEHIDRKQLLLQNFLRGIFFGAGSVLGATVLIALLLWILSLFDFIPFIGPIIENTKESIRQGTE